MDIAAIASPELVTMYLAARNLRLAQEKAMAKEKEQEDKYKAELIGRMVGTGEHALSNETQQVVLNRKEKAVAKDWPKIWAYVEEQGAWDLIARRLNDVAVKERWLVGNTIPGVDKFPVDDLTIRTL